MSFQPPGHDIYYTKLNQWGLLLSVCTYGVHIALFSHCVPSLATQGRKGWKLIAYLVALFILCSVGIGLQIWWSQIAFIDNHHYPGGPNQYLSDHVGSVPNMVITGVYMFINWLVDGLLLYRFITLWGALCPGQPRRWTVLVTVGSFIGVIVTGCAFFPQIAALGLNVWTDMTTVPAIVYLALSFSFNMILTLLIVWRILFVRFSIRQSLGKDHGRLYTSLAWLIMGSSALYAIVALMAIIVSGLNSSLQYALLPMLGQLQAIPSLVIMCRVAEGRLSYQTGHSSPTSHLEFKTRDVESDWTDVTNNATSRYSKGTSKTRCASQQLSLNIPEYKYFRTHQFNTDSMYYEDPDLDISPSDCISSISCPEKALLSPSFSCFDSTNTSARTVSLV